MNIVAIHGANHKGSTYHAARMVIERLPAASVTEYFLPRDMPHFCEGCGSCFTKSEALCPHHPQIGPILAAMEQADVLVFTSPVYVYHCSGQMKAFLDHFGYLWIVHRPNRAMFRKTALVVSTAAGAGMRHTNRDMAHSLSFWGVRKIFSYGKRVAAISWKGVSDQTKGEIGRDAKRLAKKIERQMGKTAPSIHTRLWYAFMRFVNTRSPFNEADRSYWEEQGLLTYKPWK